MLSTCAILDELLLVTAHLRRTIVLGQFQCEGSNWDLFTNQYLFQKSLLSRTLENHKHLIDSHCKHFNSIILTCHTWNISKKCPSRIYKQSKQWESVGYLWFSDVRDRRPFWNKSWFVNKSQFDPLPWFIRGFSKRFANSASGCMWWLEDCQTDS